MTQWEYILQSYQNPHLVVGNLDTEVIARFTSKAEAEKILWSMDCLATMGLRILKIPAGMGWPIWPPAPIDGDGYIQDEDLEGGL